VRTDRLTKQSWWWYSYNFSSLTFLTRNRTIKIKQPCRGRKARDDGVSWNTAVYPLYPLLYLFSLHWFFVCRCSMSLGFAQSKALTSLSSDAVRTSLFCSLSLSAFSFIHIHVIYTHNTATKINRVGCCWRHVESRPGRCHDDCSRDAGAGSCSKPSHYTWRQACPGCFAASPKICTLTNSMELGKNSPSVVWTRLHKTTPTAFYPEPHESTPCTAILFL